MQQFGTLRQEELIQELYWSPSLSFGPNFFQSTQDHFDRIGQAAIHPSTTNAHTLHTVGTP